MMTMTMRTLVRGYEAKAYTNAYIYGFTYKGMVYGVKVQNLTEAGLRVSKASRGNGYALRFRPNMAEKATFLENAFSVCTKEQFDHMVANCKYNRGEVFEKLITEMCGQVWEKDNVPFNMGADLTYKGVAYQIKFQNATFCNERQLARI